MWFLHQKLILAKDNLAKRNWDGCKKCVFCDSEESINHLFFTCPFARLVWRLVHFTFDIPPLANVTNMFRNCLNGVEKQTKARIHVGVCALIWAIWNCRNYLVFNKKRNCSPFTGYSYDYPLDSRLVLPSTGGAAGTYGYWMQPTRNGRSGYLQPGWLADF
jgi:hypothetical protein